MCVSVFQISIERILPERITHICLSVVHVVVSNFASIHKRIYFLFVQYLVRCS
jgi:hypothetical protein